MSERSIKDMSLKELVKLNSSFPDSYYIPKEMSVDININVDGKSYESLEDYIREKTEEFFDTKAEDYRDIVGCCFYLCSDGFNQIIKVTGYNEFVYHSPYTGEDTPNFMEFFYEKIIFDNNQWSVYNRYLLSDYCDNCILASGDYLKRRSEELGEYTLINLQAEGMLMLGKDGNLYDDPYSDSRWLCYKRMKDDRLFEAVKSIAK